MRLRIEKGKVVNSDSCVKNIGRSSGNNLLSYRYWKTERKDMNTGSKNKSIEASSHLRHLLGDMSQLSSYLKKKQQPNFDQQSADETNFCVQPTNFNQDTQKVCQISVRKGQTVRKHYHKITKTNELWEFLANHYPKNQAWKIIPTNTSLEYYMSLQNKDLSFLNGQTLLLEPYRLEKQQFVDLNSFDILYCIGTGGFSKVFLCRFKEDGKFYAMKVIDKGFIIKYKKKKIVMNEKKIMQKIKHPFLIQMKFAFQSEQSLIFVLELCPGGELFGLVKKFRVMNENVAKFYMIQILLGLEEIHRNGIVYRDFKPENILIDMEGHVRIADFGLAKPGIKSFRDKAYSFCGSPEYMPPEMIKKQGHSLPVDFYCLGALLYQLVTGLPPFYSEVAEQIYEGTLKKPINFPNHAKISQDLKDLLKNLLNKNQNERIGSFGGVKKVLDHTWFKNINLDSYMRKQVDPPVRFTGIKDLTLIFSEMKMKKQDLTQQMLASKAKQNRKSIDFIMENFYFDYRQRGSVNQVQLKKKREKQNNQSLFNMNSNRSSVMILRSLERSTKNIVSTQRLHTGGTMRKKPLSNRFLDVNAIFR